MLLTGTFSRVVDDKQRITIPKSLRDALGSESSVLYFAPGTDGSIALYPEVSFAQLAARLSQASPTAREVREYSRLFYAQASRSEIDGQGRVRIPQELTELVALGKEVILLGVQDHLELWNRERWEQFLARKRDHYDEIAEAAFGGSPAPFDAQRTTGVSTDSLRRETEFSPTSIQPVTTSSTAERDTSGDDRSVGDSSGGSPRKPK